MKAEVKLKKEKVSGFVRFEDLIKGEGVLFKEELRLKISPNHYLHFTLEGVLFINAPMYWPEDLRGPVRKFKLIAEEV